MGVKEAKKEAERLFKKTNQQLPVDLEKIIEDLGVQLEYKPLEDSVSGFCVKKNNEYVICVNENHSPNRQRFTIAHELGHFTLHREKQDYFLDESIVLFRDETTSLGIDSMEIEANAFAAELLMPEAKVRERICNKPVDGFDDVALKRMAEIFEVSPQALTIRLTKLNLIR
jgi:Zn-dependent peptidase ImmA (M78 family)